MIYISIDKLRNPCMTYLDNAATTAVCREAADKALYMMTDAFGNPSSLHTAGIRAEQELTAARAAVASLIGASPEEIVFTSGGTEANNLAVLGGDAADGIDAGAAGQLQGQGGHLDGLRTGAEDGKDSDLIHGSPPCDPPPLPGCPCRRSAQNLREWEGHSSLPCRW